MPQLDVSTFVPQLFWLAVCFFALFLLMKRVALPRVGAAIDARRKRLDDDLAQAQAMKSEADEIVAAYQSALAAARTRAQAMMKETGDRLSAEAAERQRELAAALARDIDAAEQQIAAAKDRALTEIRSFAAEIASSVVVKLTGSTTEPRELEAAVDRAVAERAV
jgi:F-type H+-transporting ATPase subunit b